MSAPGGPSTLSADAIARAVLYEGFALYPYRASALKNQKRLLFGTLVPCGNEGPSEAVTEVLLTTSAPDVCLRIALRFLGFGPDREETIELDDLPLESEIERAFVRGEVRGSITATCSRAAIRVRANGLPSSAKMLCVEAARRGNDGARRPSESTSSAVVTHRLRVVVRNEGLPGSANEALAMGAAHVVLAIDRGDFVSSIDPPKHLAEEAARCENVGLYPVLVGAQGSTRTMLASPIILYDYPEVALESAGDLFDATEIEEILSLRILTLTDEEKKELRGEPKARALLERVERLGPSELARLHGVLRKPSLVGKSVRLRPKGRADAYDVVLRGMNATIVSVEHTVDGDEMLCVTIDSDPGRDLGEQGIPGHRFFFRRDEVEVLS